MMNEAFFNPNTQYKLGKIVTNILKGENIKQNEKDLV